MSIFSDYKKFSRVNLSNLDDISFDSLDLGDTSSVKKNKNNVRCVVDQNYRFSSNSNNWSKVKSFNEKRELHIPKRNECSEISESRTSYIQKNFSTSCDIPSNEIISSYKFNKHVKLIDSWESSGINSILCKNIKNIAYKEPREIQKYVIPLMLKGENLQVSARTGCGKTVSYIIPVIHHISVIKSQNNYQKLALSPFAIIIVPTSELVLQISDRIIKLTSGLNVSCSRVIGGFSFFCNKTEIYQGCDIVVATVGRLQKMLSNSNIRLNSLKYLIIDECDHFIMDDHSKGLFGVMEFFGNTVKEKNVQLSFFMSVSSPNITTFLESYIGQDFTTIKEINHIVYSHINFIYNPNIIHKMCFVNERKEKPEKLLEIIRSIRTHDITKEHAPCTRIVVFTDTIRWSKELTSYICQEMPNVHCNEFNGNLSSAKREKYLEEFQKSLSEIQILVSTDLLSRGIDIYSLHYVINYDLPEHFESFHHRIGRVGRINKGIAYTLIDESDLYDCNQVPNLINLLKNIGQLTEPIQQKFNNMYNMLQYSR